MPILDIGSTHLSGGEPTPEAGVVTPEQPCSPSIPTVAMARCVSLGLATSRNGILLMLLISFADHSDCSQYLPYTYLEPVGTAMEGVEV